MLEYSIVIPLYNEEQSLEPLFSEILQVMTPLNKRYEIIFVNDGSSDRSLNIIENFQHKLPEIVKVISLEQHSGQTYALKKGLGVAQGQIAVTLDGDLQNDPADIPRLLEKINEGYDCVCGWRKARKDTFLKAGLSKMVTTGN